MQYFDVALVDKILDEEISVLDVLGLLGARAPTICGKENGRFIILVYDVVLHCIALSLNKVPTPHHLWDVVINPNEFALRGAFNIEFLPMQETHSCTFAKGHHHSGMALQFHVRSI